MNPKTIDTIVKIVDTLKAQGWNVPPDVDAMARLQKLKKLRQSGAIKADVINRDEIEARLIAVISKNQRAQLNKLLELLGNPLQLYNVPNEFWENEGRKLQRDVEPILIDIYLQQAKLLMDEVHIGIDWGMVNVNAARWANKYTYDLVKGITNTTLKGLQETIPQFYEQGWNLGQLRTSLERWYSPARAEMIAITETTRAASEGERQLVSEIQKETGIELIAIWNTSNDDIVCDICGPRNDQPITDGMYPPAHVGCRCEVSHRLPE